MHSGDLVVCWGGGGGGGGGGGSDLTEEEKERVDVQYVSMYRRFPGWGCDVT